MPTFEKTAASRPAIPHDPLPQAAESLRNKLDDVIDNKLILSALMIFMILVATAWEWMQYIFNILPTRQNAIAWTFVGSLYTLFFVYRIWRAKSVVKALKLGIRGEKHVAQYLDQTCPPLGYRVFHDIPCTGPSGPFNIDHALIGPAGIFTIETKNWSLPPKGTKAHIRFDPETATLTKPDNSYDTAAPAQANANADYLQQFLAKLTARPLSALPTRPVLLLPSWYVQTTKPSPPRGLWVFGNNTLHQWLPNEPKPLSKSDIALLASSLETHIRNFQK